MRFIPIDILNYYPASIYKFQHQCPTFPCCAVRGAGFSPSNCIRITLVLHAGAVSFLRRTCKTISNDIPWFSSIRAILGFLLWTPS